MHRDYHSKLSFWEGDVFGRLTPPPEDVLDMDRGFFTFKQNVFEEQSEEPCKATTTEGLESSLLDLEFESICSGELNGYKSGPTLAELNETRSRSPLINPEMKRLHQAAIQTVGETSNGGKPHQSTLLGQAKTHSVLEQQLKTQPSASICYDGFIPSRRDNSEQLSSPVNRSEPIRVPGRDIQTAQAQQQQQQMMGVSPPSSQERKEFLDGYKTPNISLQLISPQFGNNYQVPSREYGTYSPGTSGTTAQDFRQQQGSALNEEVSDELRSSKEEETTDQYEGSEDEDFESEEEMEDAEDYTPNEGKTPTRRKGRKSESEDMVPNPSKLLSIGRELDRLNKIISDLKPINELPQQSRGRSRKEKNKLASRACRLKKKQQHEANKVKLHGLESEQENLTFLINDMKNEIVSWARMRQKPENLLNERFQDMAKKALAQPVAGHTTEFVRKILQGVAKGNQPRAFHSPKQA